ncbi:MAG: hypothetical protein IH626_09445 [Rhodospirillales bacterium]|nr:hypothetical protein [Rhodospirillales bacterium]
MSNRFELERKRKIVSLWRAGWAFDDIRDYVGLGPDDVACVLFRAIHSGPIDPYGRTMRDVIADEKRQAARPAGALSINVARIEALLPAVTTPGLRARLISSLSSRGVPLGGAA